MDWGEYQPKIVITIEKEKKQKLKHGKKKMN